MLPVDAVPAAVMEVVRGLRGGGYAAFLVGGCVRDMLRGATPKDFDLATSARPEQVQRLFKRVIPTGIEHGTVTVVVNLGSRTIGLVVDAVSDVVALAPEQIQPRPALGPRVDADFIVGLAQLGSGDSQRLLQLVDLGALLRGL